MLNRTAALGCLLGLGCALASAAAAGPAARLAVQRLSESVPSGSTLVTDPASGALLIVRGASFALAGGRVSPAAAAQAWVTSQSAAFGLQAGVDEARLEREEPLAGGGRRVLLRQFWRGLPVVGADARAIVDGEGRLRFVAAGFARELGAPREPAIAREQAVARAADATGTALERPGSRATLGVQRRADGDHLVWTVAFTRADGSPGTAIVDAVNGDVLDVDAGIAHAVVRVYPTDPRQPLAELELRRLLPGPPLRSNTFGIDDALYPPVVPVDPDDYRLTPDNPAFDQVNLYWHVDHYLHDFLAPLGYPGPPDSLIVRLHFPLNPEVARTSENVITFGGPIPGFCREPSRAHDIVYHELTHAVLYGFGIQPGGPHREANALHEGLADYFTAALTGDPAIGEWAYLTFPDGVTRLDQLAPPWDYAHYDRVAYGGGGLSSPWANGMILGSGLWDLRRQIGAASDSIVLESLVYLPTVPDWSQFANAMLQADLDHHGGRFSNAIVQQFVHRKIIGDAAVEGWAVGATGSIIKSLDGGNTWSHSAPTEVALRGLYFLDGNNGWAAGGGLVLHTTDGGATYSTTPTGASLNSLHFLTSSTGVAVGDAGTVLRTTDGGATWNSQRPTAADLNAVYFVGSTGWIVGDGVVLKSVDSGATWTSTFPTGAVLNGVYFQNASKGWAVGTLGTILRTTDGGTTWTNSNPVSVSLYSVRFADADTGWVVGSAGAILKTTNGGGSWTEQHPVSADLKGVHFIDSSAGWAVGLGGTVLRTTDGGTNWTQVPSGTSADLTGVQFVSVPPSNVSVLVNTSRPGLSFTVDGVQFTTSQTFYWAFASTHTIATSSPQAGPAGTQYLWASWSDGGAISHTVRPTSNITINASFATQHMLTTSAGAGGTVSPASGFQDAGSVVSIRATPDAGKTFTGWAGSGTGSYTGRNNPAAVTMRGPISESGTFSAAVSATVRTRQSGTSFTVDGAPFIGAHTFTWAFGSIHSVSATSPQAGPVGTQYLWSNWSDGGAVSHNVAPTTDTTFTASFTTQYMLTMRGGSGGVVSPGSGFRDSGVVVPIGATPNPGRLFVGWTGSGQGSYSGLNPLSSVTMNGPISETGAFAPPLQPGLNLSWGDIPPWGTPARVFACNSNAGADTLIVSFVSPDSLNAFSGIELHIVAQAGADSLPPWWRLAPRSEGGCDRALRASIDFAGGPFSGRDPWSSTSASGATVRLYPDSVPNRARIIGMATRPPTQPGQVLPGIEYYGMKLILDRRNTVGAGACAGCSLPVCLRLDYIVLTQGNGLPSTTITTVREARVAGWESTRCADTTFFPKVLSVSPAAALPGTNVRIDGRLFSTSHPYDENDPTPVFSVSFNGTDAPQYRINSTKTQIDVTVPSGFTPGPVIVANGYGSATSPKDFNPDFGPRTLVMKSNPARGEAVVEFGVPEAGPTNVAVFSASGALVRTIYSGQAAAGPHEVRWDGMNGAGKRAPPGLYFLMMDHMGTRLTRRLVLLR